MQAHVRPPRGRLSVVLGRIEGLRPWRWNATRFPKPRFVGSIPTEGTGVCAGDTRNTHSTSAQAPTTGLKWYRFSGRVVCKAMR